jgi:hypothetical protein
MLDLNSGLLHPHFLQKRQAAVFKGIRDDLLRERENCARHQMISPDPEFCPNLTRILPSGHYAGDGLSMASKRTEIAIEKIIETCDGNMRGALEALLLVNELLEAELHKLYVALSNADQGDLQLETIH